MLILEIFLKDGWSLIYPQSNPTTSELVSVVSPLFPAAVPDVVDSAILLAMQMVLANPSQLALPSLLVTVRLLLILQLDVAQLSLKIFATNLLILRLAPTPFATLLPGYAIPLVDVPIREMIAVNQSA